MTAYLRGRLLVRQATPGDADALAAFECSTGPWYEEEVQGYVRGRALAHAGQQRDRLCLLLGFDGLSLVAVAAHAEEALILPEDTLIAIRIHLLAIAVADQGRVLEDGARLADVMFSTVIEDALRRRQAALVTAIVARENLRSIALCERNGLRSQTRHSAGYVRLTGHVGRRRSRPPPPASL